MKEKRCGCITYEFGPPILCDAHQVKATRRAQRDELKEERGLRRLALDQATGNGHVLTRFRQYPNNRLKYTAWCRACGVFAIVYDEPPALGDQVLGRALTEKCPGGEILHGSDAEADSDD